MPNTKSQIKEDQRTWRRINVKSTPRYVIFKLHETKYKTLKEARGKEHLTYRNKDNEGHILLPRTMQARREGSGIFNVLREIFNVLPSMRKVKISFLREIK